MAKKRKNKIIPIMLAVSLMSSLGVTGSNLSYAGEVEEVSEETVEQTPAETPAEKKEDAPAGEVVEEPIADKPQPEKKEEDKKEEEKKENKDDSKDSIANVIGSESSTVSDDTIYKVVIGYKFKDGSFDPWAEGTGFLITNKDILTTQSLTDKTTSSSLYKSVLKNKQNSYEKVGVSLNNENDLKENLIIKVINNKGEEKVVSDVFSKNGMGVITLANPESSPVAVFSDTNNIENKEGNTYRFKFAGRNKEAAEIYEKNLEVSKNETTDEGESFGMVADIEEGVSPLGAPIIDDTGSVIGMVAGGATSVLAIPTNTIQTFLATNGIDYITSSKVAEDKIKEEDKQAKEQADEAKKAAIDTTALEGVINKFSELDPTLYTQESYDALSEAVSEGKTILGASEKTQEQIDLSTKKITELTDSLVDKPKFPIKLIGLVAVGLLAIGGLVFMIVQNKKKMNEKKIKEEQEATKKAEEDEIAGYSEFLNNKKKPQQTQQYVDLNDIDVTSRRAPKELRMARNTPVDGLEYAHPKYDDDHVDVLSNNKYGIDENAYTFNPDEGSEGTTVLSGGYLIRKDNGKQISVFDNFIIGKERRTVNYCITNNSTVSRNHVRISVINGEYYIEDLESKNYTYVNGKQIPPYQKVKLENGFEIKLSNVIFTFYNQN